MYSFMYCVSQSQRPIIYLSIYLSLTPSHSPFTRKAKLQYNNIAYRVKKKKRKEQKVSLMGQICTVSGQRSGAACSQ